jgi:hypothetical protein
VERRELLESTDLRILPTAKAARQHKACEVHHRVHGDPTRDITAIRNVRTVVSRSRIVPGAGN